MKEKRIILIMIFILIIIILITGILLILNISNQKQQSDMKHNITQDDNIVENKINLENARVR